MKDKRYVGKRHPQERWRDRVLEGYASFKSSTDFEKLRQEGLRVLQRKRLLSEEELSGWVLEGERSAGYQMFVEHSRAVGARYGLAEWTVRRACLIRGYRPESDPFVLESRWPQVRIVIDADSDPLFRGWLIFEAWRLGLYVRMKHGSSESVVISVPFPAKPTDLLRPSQRPPVEAAFVVRVETPPMYPTEAAKAIQGEAQRAARELLSRLGYSVPKRLRKSATMMQVGKLRLGKPRLARRESGDIAEDIYGAEAYRQDRTGSLDSVDPKARRRVVGARSRLRRRLVES
jgi:hypothetical protein